MGIYRRARRCLTITTPADIQSAGFFDVEHWQRTGEFVAVSAVFDSVDALYAGTSREDRRAIYAERLA